MTMVDSPSVSQVFFLVVTLTSHGLMMPRSVPEELHSAGLRRPQGEAAALYVSQYTVTESLLL